MRKLALAVFLTLAVPAASAGAEQVLNKPIYDPISKSYYELIRMPPGSAPEDRTMLQGPWSSAYKAAQVRVYKGVRGRLATIKSQATHDLIQSALHPDSFAWIGLRYDCKTRQLVWSDGSIHTRQGFTRWHTQWQGDKWVCEPGTEYAPVYYRAYNGVLYWQAIGIKKQFAYALIEYPTGQP